MPVSVETINKELYNVLRSKNFDPVSLNSKGDPTDDIEQADVFRFSFTDPEENEKINGWVTVDGDNLVLYIDDNFTKNKNFEPFARFFKRWSQRKLLGFNVINKDRLLGDMKKRTVMKNKEGQINEGYYPLGKQRSYSDSIPAVKMIIQHTRQLEEGEQRFRNIAKIFVENASGERFLLPTNRPGLARVYARHIAEGGTPYDDKGKHISTLVEEYSKMAGFVRATRNGQFNESALKLVNEGLNHYNTLRMTLQGMTSHRGYNKYFENYTPVLNEETDDATSLNELFVQETLDPRIENVMPILKRLSKNLNEMSEVNELAEWAESITEVEDETTKTLAEPADEMLDELSIGTLKLTQSQAAERAEQFEKEAEKIKLRLNTPSHLQQYQTTTLNDEEKEKQKELLKKYELAAKHYRKLASKAEFHPSKMDNIKTAQKMTTMLPAKLKNIDEAPGAETLKHNQDTEKSNLKAFDLEEGDVEEGLKDVMKSVRKKFRQSAIGRAREYGYSIEEGFSQSEEVADEIMNTLSGQPNLSSDDIYRAIDEYQSMMDSPHKLDTDEVAQILYDRLEIKDLDEDLDANQKAAGQLGPTEKVGPKGAVGKLVGASESIDLGRLKSLSGIK